MKHAIVAALLASLAATPGRAETLGNRLQDGVSRIGQGAQDVGRAVGEGASRAADSVGGTVDSTKSLIEGEDTPEANRATLDAMAAASLQKLLDATPEAAPLYDESAGYAVFDTREVTLAGFTGGGGRGVAVAQDGARTYMKMASAGLGLSIGLGGFETQVVILFETEAGFTDFVTNGFDATARVGGMFSDDSESLEARYVEGRAYFYVGPRGWRVATSAAGTRYWPDDALN